jgi:hypothetical protein
MYSTVRIEWFELFNKRMAAVNNVIEYIELVHKYDVNTSGENLLLFKFAEGLTIANWSDILKLVPILPIYNKLRSGIFAYVMKEVLTPDYLSEHDPFDKDHPYYYYLIHLYREKIVGLAGMKLKRKATEPIDVDEPRPEKQARKE